MHGARLTVPQMSSRSGGTMRKVDQVEDDKKTTKKIKRLEKVETTTLREGG
ncbi:hypothetical protein GCM10022252_60810 [Streptosporangium oxazolinicum]|uniref:Uncharacterized protein n=1 Tax=Streptosporangium oxazolinicum TaxID=909287 RepID=A0ABP8BC47_9ACTN